MSYDYLNAIVYCTDPEPEGSFKKFHNIKNIESRLSKFEGFVSTRFKSAWYVNYYWRHLPKPGNFAFRRYLQYKSPAY